jgi:predicted ATPase
VVESNGQDVRVPWFSGLCLEGEVAGQYEIERSGSQQEHQDPTKASQLELDGLAPITIFVGANNSGKSRLMRELFGNSEAAKCLQVGSDSEQLKSDLRELLELCRLLEKFQPEDKNSLGKMVTAEAFQADYKDWDGEAVDGWTGINAVSLLDAFNARIHSYIRGGSERKTSKYWEGGRFESSYEENEEKDRVVAAAKSTLNDWSRRYEDIRKSQFVRRMNDYLSLRRCYVPMLRGMRPPLVPVDSNRQSIDVSDCYEERSVIDYFTGFPSWRTLNKGEANKVGRTQQKQAPAFSEKPRIFTGLSLYHDIQKRLLAPTYEERKSIRDYEMFLSANFFQGREVTLTPALHNQEGKDNDVVHIKIGESEDRPIYALGDGMQSLIICTYPIITELQRGSLFFLEEPDLCMHPSLQRVLLNVLRVSYREKGHQFFLTTHSNHLLDLLEDDDLVSIFSFSEIADRAPDPADSSQPDNANSSQSNKPKPSFRIRPSTLRDRQTLLELGVRPSATYLANATIWVEGVSDCAYLRAYMEAFVHYLKHLGNGWGKALAERLEQYKEDRHYAFVEYSGANLTHCSFEERVSDNGQTETNVPDLCGKAIVIADGDIVAKGDRIAHFVDQLKERFICLPCKEIENLIPEELMKKQIRLDHTPPQRGHVDENAIENLNYAAYARSDEGIGKYLGDLGMIKYNGTTCNGGGSGTLPTTYKSRWRSVEKGIPALIRSQIDVDKNAVDSAEIIQADDLPDYLTQDLIWLCVLLYTHIAGCNYDKNTEDVLKELQGHIKHQATIPELDPVSQQVPDLAPNIDKNSMAETIGQPETIPNTWPIPIDNTSNRSCLLTSFSPSAAQP